jgi:hypothetical protein
MTEKILTREKVAARLAAAAGADPEFGVLGAEQHRYSLAPPADEKAIVAFDRKYGVTLPDAYREFLTSVARSGAGPGSGLLTLAEAARKTRTGLARPFPLSSAALRSAVKHKAKDSSFVIFREDDPLPVDGVLPIADAGDDLLYAVVLEGTHRGKVWIVGEAWSPELNDDGKPVDFAEWYKDWLDALPGGTNVGPASPVKWPKPLAAALKDPGKATTLSLDFIRHGELEGFPDIIFTLQNLQVLDLSGYNLGPISPRIGELRELKEIYLTDTGVSAVPPELFALPKLVKLNLSRNQDIQLPVTLSKVGPLKILVLSFVGLTTLPAAFAELKQLREVDLDLNFGLDLDATWPVLASLPALETVALRECEVRQFPKSIGKPGKLKRLILSQNPLPDLERSRIREALGENSVVFD